MGSVLDGGDVVGRAPSSCLRETRRAAGPALYPRGVRAGDMAHRGALGIAFDSGELAVKSHSQQGAWSAPSILLER